MDSERVRAQLLDAIHAAEPDLVALTQALVRVPTLNPPGEYYRDICELIANWLTPHGFAAEFVRAEGTPGDTDRYPRWNVIARRQGARPGPVVHFNGHIDVVEVGLGWTRDPFGGDREGDRIYGRGTCDMKGGLAAAMIAAACFVQALPDFAGSIEISGTADEESGGFGGVAYLAQKGYFDAGRVDHVIIPEPLHKDRVCLGHRGVWWAEIETRGHIAHGSMPFLGDSAIRHMGAVLEGLEREIYPALNGRRTQMPVVPDGARVPSLNINSIHGGQAEQPPGGDGLPAPVVADSCRMVIDRRFVIEEPLQGVKGEITGLLERLKTERAGFDYAIRDLFEVHPAMTRQDSPVAASVARSIAEVLGAGPAFVVSPGTYDQKHIDRIGRMHNCIAYGPGLLELAHQPDEWISIADMRDSAQVMALTLVDLLGAKA